MYPSLRWNFIPEPSSLYRGSAVHVFCFTINVNNNYFSSFRLIPCSITDALPAAKTAVNSLQRWNQPWRNISEVLIPVTANWHINSAITCLKTLKRTSVSTWTEDHSSVSSARRHLHDLDICKTTSAFIQAKSLSSVDSARKHLQNLDSCKRTSVFTLGKSPLSVNAR